MSIALSAKIFISDINYRLRSLAGATIKQNEFENAPIESILIKNAGKVSKFIQVGSNDGAKNDPLRDLIRRYNWSGIMIEPHPVVFQKLIVNSADIKSKVQFKNIGIAKDEGILKLYYIKDIADSEPDWYDQVSSFDKATFFENISVDTSLLDRVGEIDIEVRNINTVIQENEMAYVDLVHIDAEGLDYDIITSIDFDKVKPAMILFETDWMSLYQLKQLKLLLKGKLGYKLYFKGVDCLAVK